MIILPPTDVSQPSLFKGQNSTAPTSGSDRDDIAQAAKDFEAAFITQFLQYSGLEEALTSSGGQSAQAFTSIYLEAMAKNIVEAGGLGLAENLDLENRYKIRHKIG